MSTAQVSSRRSDLWVNTFYDWRYLDENAVLASFGRYGARANRAAKPPRPTGRIADKPLRLHRTQGWYDARCSLYASALIPAGKVR